MISKYRIFKSCLISGVLAVLLTACFPDELKDIGLPFSKKEGITGEWKVISVTQVDEIAKKEGATSFSIDLTDMFGFSDFEIAFNADGTFSVNENPSPAFIDLSGTWAFDDDEFPKEVLLKAENSDEVTSRFALHKVPAPGRNLEIKFQRLKGEDVVISYIYVLSKK